MQQALACHGVMKDGCTLDREKLVARFDAIVEKELEIFIYHEVGENQEKLLDSRVLKKIVSLYPDSAIELLARAVKDVLADCHPKGLLSHVIEREKRSSLGFYISFLDGMRKHLCPELVEAANCFWDKGDWSLLQKARTQCRQKNETVARKFQDICRRLDNGEPPEKIRAWAERNVLAPLGLRVPDREETAS